MRLAPKTPMELHNAEQPEAVLSDLEAKHGSSPTVGSEAQPKTISEWFRYLMETDNFDSYQGGCTCYKCKEIYNGFAAWKAGQAEKAKPLNDQALRPRTPGLPSEPGVTD